MEVKIIFETFDVFMLFDLLKNKSGQTTVQSIPESYVFFADDSDILSSTAFLLVDSIFNRRSRYGIRES